MKALKMREVKSNLAYEMYELADSVDIGHGYTVSIFNERGSILVYVQHLADNTSGAAQLDIETFKGYTKSDLEKFINAIIYYNMEPME